MQNVGTIDRLGRALIGLALLLVAFVPSVTIAAHAPAEGLWHWVIAVVGLVLLGTSAFRFCPLYLRFGFKS